MAAAAFVGVVTCGYLVLPADGEVSPDFPATVRYEFRLAALGTQAVLWAVLGLLFGWATERAQRHAGTSHRVAA